MTDLDTLDVTMPNDLEVVMRRRFNAPRTVVFEAFTNPKYLCRWMVMSSPWSMPVCEVDLRAGGIWRFVMRDADGGEVEMRSTYREVVRPELISWHETWSGSVPESINTIVLQEDGGITIMTHTRLFQSKEDRDAGIVAGIADSEGAADAFDHLAIVLEEIAGE